MFERCLKRISALDPSAATVTSGRAPDNHAIGGSAMVAAIDPNDTIRVSQTVVTNTARERRASRTARGR